MRFLHFPLMTSAFALVLCVPAPASDVFVDAVNGSDSNGGTSSADSWRTLTHAVDQLGALSAPYTVHLAGGTYDTAHGESFPILLPDQTTILATPGVEPVLDGDGATAIFDLRVEGLISHHGVQLEGLFLRDAEVGLNLRPGPDWSATAVIRDTTFEGLTEWAIDAHAWAEFLDSVQVNLTLESVTVRNCSGGLRAYAFAEEWMHLAQAFYDIVCTDSAFIDNGYAWETSASFHGGINGGTSQLDDCHFEGNQNYALYSETWLKLDRCLLIDNGTAMRLFEASGYASECTIGGNSTGVDTGFTEYTTYELLDCIVYGNGDDLVGDDLDVRYCNIGDGDFTGTNGNLSADPLFWAPEFDDYHLRVGSPSIDSGDPTGPLDGDGSIGDQGAFVFTADYAPAPRSYCEAGINSTGRGATISSSGSVSQFAGEFTLQATGCPSNRPALFYFGGARVAAPFGAGTRCVGAGSTGLFRLGPPLMTDAGGGASRLLDFTVFPAGTINPGDSRHFQLWYRDPVGPAPGFNLSDGLTAWFLP